MRTYFKNVSKCAKSEDIVEYSQNVKSIIANSAIPVAVKSNLIANVSIGEGSSALWEDVLTMEAERKDE